MKAIAYYLPQFHPIPENDEWWGRGFTEWTNVAKARPSFTGHYQPHIPADLGFYDLRLRETRIAQAALARSYGVGGFCYYHYWFDGKLLLEGPLESMLADPEPDFPFCVCWATESWTRRWDGSHRKVLIDQNLERYDPYTHFEYLGNAFSDPRYIRVGGRPLFLIYRVDEFPDIRSTIKRWRKAAQSLGHPDVYLGVVHSHMHKLSDAESIELGFDAVVGFEPHWQTLQSQYTRSTIRYPVRRVLNALQRRTFIAHDYATLVRSAIEQPESDRRRLPCVTPSWDNTARRSVGATIIQNNDPKLFETWLRDAARRVQSYPDDEQIVFINAWNEWAEGCHLEPDVQNGHRFLEAVSNVFGECELTQGRHPGLDATPSIGSEDGRVSY